MKSIIIYNIEEDYVKAAHLVEDTLHRRKISKTVSNETKMIFEALYHNLQEKLAGSNTPVTLTAKQKMGDLKFIFGFEGGMMDPTESNDDFAPETQILKAYYDKVDYTYRFGHNTIEIDVRKSVQITQLICLAAAALAVVVYAFIQANMGTAAQQGLVENIIFPLEQLFANAMVMIAAPVTFFSLLKNRTNAYIVSEWNPTVRRLHHAALVSSIIAVLLAIAAALIISQLTNSGRSMLTDFGSLQIDFSIGDVISNLLPSNIFEPFITISPFPLIILTLMMTYALFSAGKHFDLINQLINAFYVVFSKLLSMIMFTLPFFLFTAFLDVLLQRGFISLAFLLEVLVAVACSLLLLWLYYVVRLSHVGINPFHFMKELMPLLKANYLINSCIDAVPYNIRWCVQNLNLRRKNLQESMPIMAQINLDGNCFLITLTALVFISYSGASISLINVIGIGILVLFLSMGAPNQPGSCLIGMLIIFYHMEAYSLIPLAIFTEAMFGGFQNLVNVAGDIVTIMVDENRIETRMKRGGAGGSDEKR